MENRCEHRDGLFGLREKVNEVEAELAKRWRGVGGECGSVGEELEKLWNVEENIVKQIGKQVINTQQTSWKTSWKIGKHGNN